MNKRTLLPYGEYPLQIGGVTLDVESSAESWSAEGPQTRVAENDNGTGSVWQWNGSEMIGVRLGNETATYTLNADKNLITDRQLYWTSTAPTTVTAWYPTDETVNLSDQTEGLAYMLKAEVTMRSPLASSTSLPRCAWYSTARRQGR